MVMNNIAEDTPKFRMFLQVTVELGDKRQIFGHDKIQKATRFFKMFLLESKRK